MNERSVGRLLAVTFVVSAVLRLTGFIGLFWEAVTSIRETIDGVATFWRPLVLTWVILSCVVLVSTYARRQCPDSGDSNPETSTKSDEEVRFDRLDIAEHPKTKAEALERSLDRAESVLMEQLRILADTNDKAIRTVRVEVILLGAVASATQITQQTLSVNIWMKTSGVLIVGSIVAGIFTYRTAI
ncbi:hypothetical protein [Halorussus salinus]|uniref:hypothetical protein n=1 Tax=Halorussus salinus TaxID=1364935 RepID=UPI001091B6E7|nr:hypothetical protein [Halorussus salinus]